MDTAVAIPAAEVGDLLINTNGQELLLLGAVEQGTTYRYQIWHMNVQSKHAISPVQHFDAATAAPVTCDAAIDQFAQAHGFALNGWEIPY